MQWKLHNQLKAIGDHRSAESNCEYNFDRPFSNCKDVKIIRSSLCRQFKIAVMMARMCVAWLGSLVGLVWLIVCRRKSLWFRSPPTPSAPFAIIISSFLWNCALSFNCIAHQMYIFGRVLGTGNAIFNARKIYHLSIVKCH